MFAGFKPFTDTNMLFKNMLVVCSTEKGREYPAGKLNINEKLERYYGQALVLNTTFIDQDKTTVPSSNVIKGEFPNDVRGKFDIIWFAGCNFVNGWLFKEEEEDTSIDKINKFRDLLKDDGIFFFTEVPCFNRSDSSIKPFVVLDNLMKHELNFNLMEPEDIKKFYSHFGNIVEPVEGFEYIYRLK